MTQATGILSPYLQRRRLDVLVQHMSGSQLSVLDLGCDSADLVVRLGERLQRYVGVDISEAVVAENKQRYPVHTFITGSVTAVEFPPGPYNYVCLAALIEHLHREEVVKLLSRLRPLLKPDGAILITTPRPRAERVHELGAAIGIFSKEAAHEHQVLFDRRELEEVVVAAGLRMTRYQMFELGFNQLCVCQTPASSAGTGSPG